MQQLLGGRYRLADELGRGSIGTVYRATDELLTRPVALKVVDPELASDDDTADRIRQAGSALARLTHPNLVTLFDVTHLDGQLCIVTEFVDGPHLGQLIDDGGVNADKIAALGRDLAAALGTAHAADVLHGHLHPRNVLLTRKGIPKLVDLGLALHQVAGGAVGDHAREWLPADEPVTPAFDVYALGALLRAATADSGARRSHDLLDVLDAATIDDPGARLQNGQALATALRSVAGSSGGGFVPPLRRREDPGKTAVLDVVSDERTAAITTDDDPARTRVMAVHDAPASPPASAPPVPPEATGQMPEGSDGVEGGREATVPSDPDGQGPTPWLGRVLSGAALLVVALLVVGQLTGTGPGGGSGTGGDGAERTAVAVRGASDFDPLGGGGEHGSSVPESYDGVLETAWTTEGYDRADLGGLKSGVGVVYDLGESTSIARIRASFVSDGSSVEFYAFDDEPGSDPASWGSAAASISSTTENDVIDLGGTTGRYWLVWFTQLGPYEGRYRGGIGEIVFEAG